MAIIFEVEVPSPEPDRNQDQNRSVALQGLHQERKTAPNIWKVSELTQKIRRILEGEFRSVILEGELSNFKSSGPGHLYFVLKDDQAQIRGVMFKNAAGALKFVPEDGLEVIVTAHLTVYPPRGEYQLNVSSMEPKGIGALQLAFEQLKKKLAQEGLFDPAHKRPIPFLPRRIGIVTSPTGAVIHDMLTVLHRRFPGIPVLIYPALVQGEDAARQVIQGIRYFNQIQPQLPIDVLIVGRGGGSIEDLWAFNEEALAREIFNSQIPVISAVGHETDTTIADYVSDLRAPTPSAAMELAVPRKQDLLYTLGNLTQRLERSMEQQLKERRNQIQVITRQLQNPKFIIQQQIQRVDDLTSLLHSRFNGFLSGQRRSYGNLDEKLFLLTPAKNLANLKKTVDQFRQRLERSMSNSLQRKQERLKRQVSLLDSLSPLTIIKRGYGMVTHKGRLVKTVNALKEGDGVSIRLEDGSLEAQVLSKAPLLESYSLD
ncbi:exodeoxyribonuclease VII large subunit [Deltaproteobacteria bacterium TL4]